MDKKIGITERGDAGIDFSWTETVKKPEYAGAVLVTKRMSDRFIQEAMRCPKPVVVHCTCTGNGGTWVEPNAPDFKTQLAYLARLLKAGFPSGRAVLRIDPIIPTPELLGNSRQVLEHVAMMRIPVRRVRISLMDQYPHVVQRLKALGKPSFYPDQGGRSRFHPDEDMKKAAMDMLLEYPYLYETCAEDWAARIRPDRFAACGCISRLDLEAMNLKMPEALGTNPQNRSGCHCLGIKSELLKDRKPCPNKCVYCYWKG